MAIPRAAIQDRIHAARVPRASIQDRIGAILQAAQIYKERYTVMADVFVLLHQMMREGAISPSEAMERFFSQLSAGTISIEAAGVIEAEQARYNLTRRRNDYMREYQRRRRGSALRASSSDTGGALAAPYDDAAANAMTLAEIEAAIAGAGAFRAPSDNASTNAAPGTFGAPSNDATTNLPNNAEPSIAFDAELSADDLL